MTSILRLRLVEAATLIKEEYPHAVELRLEPTAIRVIGRRGLFTVNRLVSWDEAENAEINTLTIAIHSAVRQLRKQKDQPYDTSMGL